MDKPIIYSAMQPTGILTIGNYIGAISNWIKLKGEYDSIFGIADLHALTVRQKASEFRDRVYSFFAQYLAAGLDPKDTILYIQSHVPEHSELTWILNCHTYLGELSRMIQFKDKAAKHEDNVNAGLFTYPVLMAADILLYQTNLVPTGADQKQHIELARDIAIRFNNLYSPTFTVPEPYIKEGTSKIYSLQNPAEKMSKSDEDPNASVSLIDPPEVIMNKFRRAVTDSGTVVEFREDKPGVSNLLTIMSECTGRKIADLVTEYHDSGYQKFKSAVGEAVVEKFRPVREEYGKLIADKAYLQSVAKEGAQKASYLARKTLSKVRRKAGLTDR
jgi:tryptophanyl-tRNA synthetase